jgi:Kef-type K+ transport system membrane component KefB
MKYIGQLFLAVFLILFGLKAVINLNFRHDDLVIGIVALVAGVFVLIRR